MGKKRKTIAYKSPNKHFYASVALDFPYPGEVGVVVMRVMEERVDHGKVKISTITASLRSGVRLGGERVSWKGIEHVSDVLGKIK